MPPYLFSNATNPSIGGLIICQGNEADTMIKVICDKTLSVLVMQCTCAVGSCGEYFYIIMVAEMFQNG